MSPNRIRPSFRPNRVAAGRATQRGFTLVEIMVVIVILGLLATLVVPNVLGMSDEAKRQKAQTDVKTILEQAKIYKMRNNKTPTIEDLTTPDEKGHAYIEDLTNDPWDHEYVIREIENNRFEVVSMGPDGAEGTEDDVSSNLSKNK